MASAIECKLMARYAGIGTISSRVVYGKPSYEYTLETNRNKVQLTRYGKFVYTFSCGGYKSVIVAYKKMIKAYRTGKDVE